MPNKYKDIRCNGKNLTDLIDEEDREVDNDLKRAKTEYYAIHTKIAHKVYDALDSMSEIEIKEIIKGELRVPVEKL